MREAAACGPSLCRTEVHAHLDLPLSFLQFITAGVVLICRDRFRGRFRGGRAEHAVDPRPVVQGGGWVAGHHRHRALVSVPAKPNGAQGGGSV